MNIIDAITALAEGRCESILRVTDYGDITVTQMLRTASLSYESIMSNSWQLVGEKPVFVEEEVTRWLCPCCGCTYQDKCSAEACCLSTTGAVKLSGVIMNEVKPKVKHRVKFGRTSGREYCDLAIPNTAEFFAEWEE